MVHSKHKSLGRIASSKGKEVENVRDCIPFPEIPITNKYAQLLVDKEGVDSIITPI